MSSLPGGDPGTLDAFARVGESVVMKCSHSNFVGCDLGKVQNMLDRCLTQPIRAIMGIVMESVSEDEYDRIVESSRIEVIRHLATAIVERKRSGENSVEVERSNCRLSELEHELAQSSQERRDLEREVGMAKESLSRSESELTKYRNMLETSLKELKTTEDQSKLLESRISISLSGLKGLAGSVMQESVVSDGLLEDIEFCKSAMAKLQAERDHVKAENEECKASVTEKERELVKSIQERRDLERDVLTAKESLVRSESEVSRYREMVEVSLRGLQTTEDQVKSMESRISVALSGLKGLTCAVIQESATSEGPLEDIEFIKSAFSKLQSDRDRLKEDYDGCKALIVDKERELIQSVQDRKDMEHEMKIAKETLSRSESERSRYREMVEISLKGLADTEDQPRSMESRIVVALSGLKGLACAVSHESTTTLGPLDDINFIRSALEKIQSERDCIKTECEQYRSSVAEKERELADVVQQRGEYERGVSEKKALLEKLGGALKRLEDVLDMSDSEGEECDPMVFEQRMKRVRTIVQHIKRNLEARIRENTRFVAKMKHEKRVSRRVVARNERVGAHVMALQQEITKVKSNVKDASMFEETSRILALISDMFLDESNISVDELSDSELRRSALGLLSPISSGSPRKFSFAGEDSASVVDYDGNILYAQMLDEIRLKEEGIRHIQLLETRLREIESGTGDSSFSEAMEQLRAKSAEVNTLRKQVEAMQNGQLFDPHGIELDGPMQLPEHVERLLNEEMADVAALRNALEQEAQEHCMTKSRLLVSEKQRRVYGRFEGSIMGEDSAQSLGEMTRGHPLEMPGRESVDYEALEKAITEENSVESLRKMALEQVNICTDIERQFVQSQRQVEELRARLDGQDEDGEDDTVVLKRRLAEVTSLCEFLSRRSVVECSSSASSEEQRAVLINAVNCELRALECSPDGTNDERIGSLRDIAARLEADQSDSAVQQAMSDFSEGKSLLARVSETAMDILRNAATVCGRPLDSDIELDVTDESSVLAFGVAARSLFEHSRGKCLDPVVTSLLVAACPPFKRWVPCFDTTASMLALFISIFTNYIGFRFLTPYLRTINARVTDVAQHLERVQEPLRCVIRSANGAVIGDGSFSHTLSVLFPPESNLTPRSNPCDVRRRLSCIRSLLVTSLNAISDTPIPAPPHIYGLALAIDHTLSSRAIQPRDNADE